MDYKPAPRDTSGVKLPRQIAELTELLAKNTHENWAVASPHARDGVVPLTVADLLEFRRMET